MTAPRKPAGTVIIRKEAVRMDTEERKEYADVVIAGTGVAGLYSALNLPRDKKIIMITKSDVESSDSFLAQGGICEIGRASCRERV